MSKHYTRKKSVTDSCLSCNERIPKNEKSFDCAMCGNRMHLSERCTELSDVALKGILALGKNVLLLCSKCVGEKCHETIMQDVKENNENQKKQMQNIEAEMTAMKQTISEIKTFLTHKAKETEVQNPVTASAINIPMKPPEELDEIRIRGIEECADKNPMNCQNYDYTEVQKILTHLNVSTEISDIIRLGKYDENKTNDTDQNTKSMAAKKNLSVRERT